MRATRPARRHSLLNRFQAIDPHVLRLRPGERLLDVGCGIGRHVLETGRVAGCHIGIDMVRDDLLKALYWRELEYRAGRLHASVSFLQGDASRLPLRDGCFDKVVCTEVLEHVPSDRAVLLELARVLRPGGVLAVSVPDEISERLLWRLSRKYRTTPNGHVRIYSRHDIARLLQDGGIRLYAVRYRHSLEALYWLFGSLVSPEREDHPLVMHVRRVLSTMRPGYSAFLDRCDDVGNYVLPKSIVLYGRKLGRAPP